MAESTSERQTMFRDEFAHLYGRLPVPLLLIAADGTIAAANASASELLATTPEKLVGKTLPACVSDELGRVSRYLSACRCSGANLPGALHFLNGKGETVEVRCDGAAAPRLFPGHVLMQLSPKSGGNVRFFALNEKIAQLDREVAERRRMSLLLEAQNELLGMIASDARLDDVLDNLLRSVEQYTGEGLLASVLLLDEDGIHLRHGAAPSLPGPYTAAIDGVAIGPSVGSCGTAAYRREAVIVADIAVDPLWADYRELALGHGLRACWSIPIHSASGKVLGTFAMYYGEPRTPSPIHWSIIRLVTRTAAIAIERNMSRERVLTLMAEQAGILNGLPARIGLIGADGSLRFANRIWTEWANGLAGIDGPPDAGSFVASMSRLFRPTSPGVDAGYEIQRLLEGRAQSLSLTCTIDESQSARFVQLSAAPLLADAPAPRDIVIMHVDVTEQKTAETELLRQASELAQMNSDLQQFAYVASHDLREPLRTVRSFAQLFVRRFADQVGPEASQYLGYIDEGVKRMEHLLDDLLVYSRVAEGKTLERGPVALRAALTSALQNLHAVLVETGAEVIASDLPVVVGLEGQITQVLQNLISNAIKYRGTPTPVIRITCEELDDGWRVSVADNGRGIEPQYHEQVFGLFKRLHSREIPGTGIGLALCKKIIENHGGTIWVESQPGVGSTFRFTIAKVLPASTGAAAPDLAYTHRG